MKYNKNWLRYTYVKENTEIAEILRCNSAPSSSNHM